ncbi:MAG TPA: hypothetical protein PK572_09600 [Kiritimatiellia bacterium]|jgi:hypothetical protein|nr:hypothetical protein [Kiritimatiellia bacterium]
MITLEKFFEALNQVEARGRKRNVPAGDGGTRIGPLQISEIYWKDAREWMNKQNTHFIPDIYWSWTYCEDWEFSKTIAFIYFRRWAPKALREGNWEVLARIHNGGPNGHKKKATLEYWEKVKEALEEIERRKP